MASCHLESQNSSWVMAVSGAKGRNGCVGLDDMEVLEDVVLEFAQGAVEVLSGDGFGAEEHAVDICLGEAGGLEVGQQEVVEHVEVSAVVGLGEVHHVFDFEGAMAVVDFIEAECFDGVINVRIGGRVPVQNYVPGICGVV